MIDFDAKSWSRGDALFWIFLSDEIAFSDGIFRKNSLDKYVLALLKNDNADIEGVDDDCRRALRKLQPVLKTLPGVEVASPLLWIRFAHDARCSGASWSTRFVKKYSLWRFRHLSMGAQVVTCLDENRTLPKFVLDDNEYTGYSLDSFFFRRINANSRDWKIGWFLDRVKSAVVKTKNKVDVSDHVGSGTLKILKKCVASAARGGLIDGLGRRKVDGRYKSGLSRRNLAAALKKIYGKELPARESTIVRALSEFVACPNYRPGKFA